MRDIFYSPRHLERVQAIENKAKLANGLMAAFILGLFIAVSSAVGTLDYEYTILEAGTSQNALYEVTGPIYVPTDIQPAYGSHIFQHATSGWTLQGDVE